jgi:hypothetical protein
MRNESKQSMPQFNCDGTALQTTNQHLSIQMRKTNEKAQLAIAISVKPLPRIV